MSLDENEDKTELPVKVKTVASTILAQFFNALEDDEILAEVSLRLRKIVLEDGIFAEPSIRTALFPDAS
jgi:hypothetical protein